VAGSEHSELKQKVQGAEGGLIRRDLAPSLACSSSTLVSILEISSMVCREEKMFRSCKEWVYLLWSVIQAALTLPLPSSSAILSSWAFSSGYTT
jgi:hypothetical protein